LNTVTVTIVTMPELSRFFGILIRMYAELDAPHHKPHFHAYYQDSQAVFSIDPVEIIEGALPDRQRRLVLAWAEIHQFELLTDWDLLQEGKVPVKIEPLH